MERLLDETEHSIAAHHGAHTNPSNAPYPLPLTHTAALQQHLVEARMTRRHNRAPNAYDSESPSIDYPGQLKSFNYIFLFCTIASLAITSDAI